MRGLVNLSFTSSFVLALPHMWGRLGFVNGWLAKGQPTGYQREENTMAANNSKQHTFINLAAIQGSGEVGRYKDDVCGVLVGIEPRAGFYKVTDRKTGEVIDRPNSWTAYFEDGSMWSWPTYIDPTTGNVMPWSRFDPTINLAQCVAERRVIHVWKDDRNFSHLELVEEKVTAPVAKPAAAMPMVAPGFVAPWEA